MRAREFEHNIAALLAPWTSSEIDQRTRVLRDAGLLPVGGRGLNAPHINAQHQAAIFISLCATKRAADAAERVPVYSAMVPVEGDIFADAPDFGAAFKAILSDPHNVLGASAVVICKSFPEAAVTYETSGNTRKTVYRPAEEPAPYKVVVREDITLTASFLVGTANFVHGAEAAAKKDDDA